MQKKFFVQLVIPLLALCLLFLCLDSLRTDPQEEELLQISVIPMRAELAEWSSIRLGMEQAAADLDVELRILTVTVSGSAVEQMQMLEHEAAAGTDAIVLTPANRAALMNTVTAVSGQTPVVTMETDMSDAGAADCIGVDNVHAGETLARMAASAVKPGGRVLLLDSSNGAVQERLAAAASCLEKKGIVSVTCAPGIGQSLLGAMTEALQTAQFDAVIAFEATSLETAAAAAAASEQFPRLYGAGVTNRVAAYLEQGHITAIIARNEFSAGYLAVASAAEAARNGSAGPSRHLSFSIIRPERMYDPENQKLLFPLT